jgi:dTDP-4-dehydrorhamnose 3,5-epimerase-like enzyme
MPGLFSHQSQARHGPVIYGVETKELATHRDECRVFRELIRDGDPIFPKGFGQWSHTMSYQGVTKA